MNTPHKMIKDFAKLMNDADQMNCYDTMLQSFTEWSIAVLPEDVEPGPKKSCFETCQKRSAWENNKALIYCEGFAASENLSIPMMHAWLLRDGKVIDPVWRAGKHEYFGVEIPTKVVLETITRTKVWGSIIEAGYIRELDVLCSG
jgi:hypothetical protein